MQKLHGECPKPPLTSLAPQGDGWRLIVNQISVCQHALRCLCAFGGPGTRRSASLTFNHNRLLSTHPPWPTVPIFIDLLGRGHTQRPCRRRHVPCVFAGLVFCSLHPTFPFPLIPWTILTKKRSHLDQVLDGYVRQTGIFVSFFRFPLLSLIPDICSVVRWGIDGPTDWILDQHFTFAVSRNHPPASEWKRNRLTSFNAAACGSPRKEADVWWPSYTCTALRRGQDLQRHVPVFVYKR